MMWTLNWVPWQRIRIRFILFIFIVNFNKKAISPGKDACFSHHIFIIVCADIVTDTCVLGHCNLHGCLWIPFFILLLRGTNRSLQFQELGIEQNPTVDTDIFSCPICYEPLIRKGPSGLNLYVFLCQMIDHIFIIYMCLYASAYLFLYGSRIIS